MPKPESYHQPITKTCDSCNRGLRNVDIRLMKKDIHIDGVLIVEHPLRRMKYIE